MQTVLVYLIGTDYKEVGEYLSEHYPEQTEPWCAFAGENDAALYINFYKDFIGELEDVEIEDLVESLGKMPDVCVMADVSNRHLGEGFARKFVENLLANFKGVADDGLINYFWTLQEIRKNKFVRNYTFFDEKNLLEPNLK